jgi:hypothetical protein
MQFFGAVACLPRAPIWGPWRHGRSVSLKHVRPRRLGRRRPDVDAMPIQYIRSTTRQTLRALRRALSGSYGLSCSTMSRVAMRSRVSRAMRAVRERRSLCTSRIGDEHAASAPLEPRRV